MNSLLKHLRGAAPLLPAVAAPISVVGAAEEPLDLEPDSRYAGRTREELQRLFSPHRPTITQTPSPEPSMSQKIAYNPVFGGPRMDRPVTQDLTKLAADKTAGPFAATIMKGLVGGLGNLGRPLSSLGSKFKSMAPDALQGAAELLSLRDPQTSRLIRQFASSMSDPQALDDLVGRAGRIALELNNAAMPDVSLGIIYQKYSKLDPEWAASLGPYIRRLDGAVPGKDDDLIDRTLNEIISSATARDAQVSKALQAAANVVDEGADHASELASQADQARSARNMAIGLGAVTGLGVVGDTLLDSVVAPGLSERSKARAQDDIRRNTSLFDRAGVDEVAAKSLAQSIAGGLGEGLVGAGGSVIGAGMSVTRGPEYDRLFSSIVMQDNLLSRATPEEMQLLRDSYRSMQQASPTLARDVFAVKNFLREVYSTGNGPDYATISNLARSEQALQRK